MKGTIVISSLILLPTVVTVYAEHTEPTPNSVIKTVNTENFGGQVSISSEIEKTDNSENANTNSMMPIPSAAPSTTEIPDTESNNNLISEFYKGWNLHGDDWYYLDSDDQNSYHQGWLYTGGKWYWLDPETGIMATGLRNIEGNEYYFYSSGSMASNCWINLDDSNIPHFRAREI